MNNPHSKFNGVPRAGMPVFGTYNNSQASILLEKSNPGLRRSTPDSEALASSDEELDASKFKHATNKTSTKTARRTFSLADHPSINRKPSMTASGTYSPTTSNPTTPATDQNVWATMSPSGTTWGNATGYPWHGSSIWSQKEPPSRLQQVNASESSSIPFNIPLEPTIKTYRSQSYSVGQIDPPPQPVVSNRSAQAPTVQRRTSRPGMISGDVNSLARLREVDDDEETLDVTQRNVEQAREIERLNEENARLRAATRDRTMSSNSMHGGFRGVQMRGVPDSSDPAIDDGESSAYQYRNALSRRFSEQLTQYPDRQPFSPGTNTLSRWQTTGGRLADIPQSRRHSFADVPTRQGSFSSHGEALAPLFVPVTDQKVEPEELFDNASRGYPGIDDPEYFKLDEKRRQQAEASVQQGVFQANPYGMPMSTYGGPGQSFAIVNFKCCRSDIFFVQEGTGLHVQVGDLVIVDADRGTDLGAVQHVNVTLDEARRYKEYYAEEHYKLLMMFSQQTKNGGMNAVNPNGPPTRQSAVGGMGPQGHGHRDGHGDPKAKMIKRLAQAHEMQALKEKEGNEAKAKRVCTTKVIEHGLNMEILDAEFQMDNKKLTFYYFADEYINFNALVTDLFKIYKTRIWMSAINPASFQTPTSSLGINAYVGGFGSPVENNRRPHYGGIEYDDRSIPRGAAQPFYPSYQQNIGRGAPMPTFNQQTMDPFAPYPAPSFGMFGQAPGFGMGQQAPTNNGNPSNQDWTARFQGLSMGS